jgi:hydroxylamine dehydrogenase
MDLVDVKSEANRLRERKSAGAGAAQKASVEEELRTLKNKLERGAISKAEYEKEKAKVLERM